MVSAPALTRAIAIDIRDRFSTSRLGVALAMPSVRQLWMLTDVASTASRRSLADGQWKEIERWVDAGDAGLPAQPAPLSSAVVSAFFDQDQPSAVATRVASIPVTGEFETQADRVLHELLATGH